MKLRHYMQLLLQPTAQCYVNSVVTEAEGVAFIFIMALIC